MKKSKALIINLILLFVVCLVFLTILEIVLRVTEEESKTNELLIFDNETLYLMRPNLEYHLIEGELDYNVKTNNDGFRDIDFENYLYKNEIILNLGDSMTYGKGVEVEETFSNLIEDQTEYSVLNLGVSGFATFQEYYIGERYAKEYKPDIIILNVFYGNDLAENLGIINRTLQKTEDSVQGRAATKDRHSYTTFEKVKTFFRETLGLKSYLFLAQRYDNTMRNFNFKPPIRVNSFTLKIFDKTKEDDTELSEAYEKTFINIDKINDLAKENNAEFIVVLMPPRFQVRDSEWEDTINQYTIGDENFIRDLPNQIFKEYFKEKEINYVDLLPSFMEVSDGTYYYNYDGHWTSKGHELATEQILTKIK